MMSIYKSLFVSLSTIGLLVSCKTNKNIEKKQDATETAAMVAISCDSMNYLRMNSWLKNGEKCDGNIYHYLDVVVGCGLKKDSLAIVVRKAMQQNCSMEHSPAVSWFLRDDGDSLLADSFENRFLKSEKNKLNIKKAK